MSSMFLELMDEAENAEDIAVMIEGKRVLVGDIVSLTLCQDVLFAAKSTCERVKRRLLNAVGDYRSTGLSDENIGALKEGLTEGEIIVSALKERMRILKFIDHDARLLPRYQALLDVLEAELGPAERGRLQALAKDSAPAAWAPILPEEKEQP